MRHLKRQKGFPATGSLRGFGATALALSMLAGASTDAQARPDIAAVKQFARRGYVTDDQYGIATSFATVPIGGSSVDLALMVPARPGLAPLVVYLPATGETRSAGQALRSAWAKSGYAVLSLQPLPVEALGKVLAAVTERAHLHEAPFDRIDLARVGLAGLELGADAALAATGALPLPVAAVISLNEAVGTAGAADTAVGLPLLSVSADAATRIRRVAAGGDRYLLTLADTGASPTAAAIEVATVQAVTTAFLDAHVKRDSAAREWLAKDAPRWLGVRV
ncbi:MAG TPA: hypothetical protein VF816_13540 [Rhodocyclaceae bacterium]